MSVLVVGSIAFDSIETPFGKAEEALGGSALHFSAASRFYTPVHVVGVVGSDFDMQKIHFLQEHQVNLDGIVVEEGKTFRWGGRYHQNMNKRDTLFTHLNVFENFKPVIPEHYRNDRYVFLANIHPQLQIDVLDHMNNPELVVLDTMNLWIHTAREALLRLIPRIDVLIINDEELFDLTGAHHLLDGARELMKLGPQTIIIKKGEHGAVLISPEGLFLSAAYPVSNVVDPTGAGDSFAGGFLGYLSTQKDHSNETLRRAIVHGAVAASYLVEDFGFSGLIHLNRQDLDRRVDELRRMTAF